MQTKKMKASYDFVCYKRHVLSIMQRLPFFLLVLILGVINSGFPCRVNAETINNIALFPTTTASASNTYGGFDINAPRNGLTDPWDMWGGYSVNGVYYEYDFGREYDIRRIELVTRVDVELEHHRRNWEIIGYKDPRDGGTVLGEQGSSALEPGATWILELDGQNSYRYIRMRKTAKAGEDMTIIEFRVFGVIPPLPAEQHEIYVSPLGDDSNTGTEKLPFKTIERAKSRVSEISGEMNRDINVWIRGGKYQISQTISLNEQDSGKNGFNVNYRAYPGEKPIISGGKAITGWSYWQDGIYRAECGNLAFRQLYIDNERGIRARTPDKGSFYRLVSWNTTDRTIRINNAELDDVQNLAQGNVEMIVQMYWAESTMRIESYTTSSNDRYKNISVNEYEKGLVFPRDWPPKKPDEPYHFENSLDFLNAENEWFLDKSVTPHVVYYKPKANQNMDDKTVIAPYVETLLEVKGTTLDLTVQNIGFYGLSFEHSTFLRPDSYGNVAVQANQYTTGLNRAGRSTSAVLVQNANNLVFERNNFRNLGSAAIDIYSGTSDISITGNIIKDISGNGIVLGEFSEKLATIGSLYNPADLREVCTNVSVTNNLIYRVGQDYFGSCGIAAGYIRDANLSHNIIKDMPFTGISIGWGWYLTENPMRNNLIEYNHIYGVLNMLCDGGGIYTLSNQPGTMIRYNYIHSLVRTPYTLSYPVVDVYLDEGSSNITVDANSLAPVPPPSTGTVWKKIHLNGAKDNIVTDNNPDYDEDIALGSGIESTYNDILLNIDYIIVKNADGEITQLKPLDEIEVIATVSNDRLVSADAALSTAVYRADGVLHTVATETKNIEKDGKVKLINSIKLPNDTEGYTLKSFVWEDLANLKPVGHVVTVTN